jgi:hypothetical protein
LRTCVKLLKIKFFILFINTLQIILCLPSLFVSLPVILPMPYLLPKTIEFVLSIIHGTIHIYIVLVNAYQFNNMGAKRQCIIHPE